MRWAVCVTRMVYLRNAYQVLVYKPEGKDSLRRPRFI